MFSKNLLVTILVNGRPLSDNGGKVFLPFGSEYEIHFKNLDARRVAITELFIDGINLFNSKRLILDSRETTVLKGFCREFDPSLAHDYAFRFIEKTEKISAHRGDRAEDGLITVRFGFEQQNILNLISGGLEPSTKPVVYGSSLGNQTVLKPSQGVGSALRSAGESQGPQLISPQASLSADAAAPAVGITTKGRDIEQAFSYTIMGTLGDYGALTLQLFGQTADGADLKSAVEAEGRIGCEMCGTSSPAKFKYCPECGSNLH